MMEDCVRVRERDDEMCPEGFKKKKERKKNRQLHPVHPVTLTEDTRRMWATAWATAWADGNQTPAEAPSSCQASGVRFITRIRHYCDGNRSND